MRSHLQTSDRSGSLAGRVARRLGNSHLRLGTWQGVALGAAGSLIVTVADMLLHQSLALATPLALVVTLVAWLSTPAAGAFTIVFGSATWTLGALLVWTVAWSPEFAAMAVLRMLVLGVLGYLAHQLRRALGFVRTMAVRDQLTGLLNRRGFLELAEHEAARSQREGVPFTVAVMDIDDFKAINDHFGHEGGDAALVRFAQHAAGRLRATDVIGRTGGDEFFFVLPVGREAATIVLREVIDVPRIDGVPDLMISAGAVSYARAPDSIYTALNAADKEMYEAKRHHLGLRIRAMPD
jgi:diguanylate cyclase (GGDEF)-like protein